MFNVSVRDMKHTESSIHMLNDSTITVAQLQKRLDSKFYGEMIITTEGLTKQAINENKLRVANYGDGCEIGSTYFIGTLTEVEEYVNHTVRNA